MNDKDIIATAAMLKKHWSVQLPEAPNLEQLREAVRLSLAALLKEDLHGLVQTMYRLDIPEARFHAAMMLDSQKEICEALTDLVIEREMLRVRIWNQYQNSGDES